ncbi:MAG: dephospho-CoA kinase [Pseudomonadota bacterium]
MPYTVGLTGGIGSGKTAASDQFARHGIDIVDADLIAKQVTQPGTEAVSAIEQHFGEGVMVKGGNLNREALRAIIFNDADAKNWLEQLLHPIIREHLLQQLKAAQSRYVILSAPLLLENKLDALCDCVLVIDCSEDTQIKRTLARDHSNRETIKNIISQQLSRRSRLQKADHIITNEGSLKDLQLAIDKFHLTLLEDQWGQSL